MEMKNKKITELLNYAKLKLIASGPKILLAGGVIGIVGSSIMACIATTKTSSILAESKNDIKQIHEAKETFGKTSYSDKSMKKDLTKVYVRTFGRFIKLYAPSVILGVLSLSSVITSNEILRRRTVALSAAYAAVDKSFKDYRFRVKERFGEETDRDFRYGLQTKTVEEKVIDEKSGKEKKIKKEIKVASGNGFSEYARVFDKQSSTEWVDDFEYNLMRLKQEQNWLNELLWRRGYLYLNEVYERLGFETTKAGQIVGWVANSDNPNSDNYVDFGITDAYNTNNVQNADGYERVLIVDFNVDGPIIDLVHKYKI